MKLSKIAEILEAEVKGGYEIDITGIAEIDKAEETHITFIANPKYKRFLKDTKAGAIISSENIEIEGKTVLKVKNVYWAIAKLIDIFYPEEMPEPKISEFSDISKDAEIGRDVYIDSFVKIEKGACIKDRVIIYSNTYIGRNSSVGEGSIIYPNVTIRENVVIGRNVIIHSGAVIGGDGFGYYRVDNVHKKIPQRGRVVIEDDVEIGSNTTIDRGTFSDTVIGYGTKIDNLVQIAHNVKIGRCCIIVAQVGIAGSTKIGDYVTIAGQAGIAGHLNIGDKVIIGAQAGVISDIENGEIVSGYPAREHTLANKSYALLYRLPEFFKEFKILKEKIEKFKR